MNLRPIGQVAQAIITDPLIGSASGYALVAASPSLSRPDADALERQPLVSDYLHLFEDPGGEARSFFAFHPLPSGSWALTRRFFEGKRRGSFNRVVVHALILPPALLDQIEDPLALRAFGRFEGGRTWVQLGDVLVAQLLGPQVAPTGKVSQVNDLHLALPGDFAELRIQQILSQLKALRRQWGDELLQRHLVTALTVFSGQEARLLLEPGEELFFAFVLSLLPCRERCRLAWASFVPPEAAGSFRLLLTENPRDEAARQPDRALTLAFESSLRVPGAEALADLVFREGLLEDWLRQEKGLGASLREGRGFLAAQIECLVRGTSFLLEDAEESAELWSPLEVLGRLLEGGAAGEGGEFARALWGQLSPDPGQRLRQGFELLGNRELPEEVLLLLEGEFLELLLEKAGDRLPLWVPAYEEIERDLGIYAQLRVARYVGGASGRLEPLPTEFLRGALRADRRDLVGAFLRAAGGDYLRRLGREKGGRDVVKGLRGWWLSGRRLELAPLGGEILRLEVVL